MITSNLKKNEKKRLKKSEKSKKKVYHDDLAGWSSSDWLFALHNNETIYI